MDTLLALLGAANPVLGLIGGAVTRIMTGYMSYKDKKLDNEHELKMLEKRMELEKLQAESKREEVVIQNTMLENQEWLQSVAKLGAFQVTGDKFVDRLNATVRPFLTLWWCAVLYTVYKSLLVYVAVKTGLPADQIAKVVVNDFDMTVIGSIFGFWFLDRQLTKSGK